MKRWAKATIVVCANFLCIVALSLPILFIYRYAAPLIRGFDPDDVGIALPYKEETIGGVEAILGAVAIAFFFIFPIELLMSYISLKRERKAKLCSVILHSLSTILPVCGVFWACLAINGVLTDTIKYMVARPRPCFLDVCKPNYTMLEYEGCNRCGSADAPSPSWPLCPTCLYVNAVDASRICADNSKSFNTNDIWLSFPSGHSSYTFVSMTYVAAYIFHRLGHLRTISHVFVILRPFLMLSVLIYAVWVALTRVADNRHRVSDVLAGAFLGGGVGIWTFINVTATTIYRVSKSTPDTPCLAKQLRDVSSVNEPSAGPINEDGKSTPVVVTVHA